MENGEDMATIPTTREIREYLENFQLDIESSKTVTGNTTQDSPDIVIADTRTLKEGMRIAGTGIPAGSEILVVQSGQITISANATETGAGVSLTITYYSQLTDGWISRQRDGFIIPWIEQYLGRKISEEKTYQRFYSGMGESVLVLDHAPVTEIVTLKYVVNEDMYEPASISEIGRYVLSKETGVIKKVASLFLKGEDNIFCEYKVASITEGEDDVLDNEVLLMKDIIMKLTLEVALGQVANRTGGGQLSSQGYSRSFGNRGKFSDIRNDLANQALSSLKLFFR